MARWGSESQSLGNAIQIENIVDTLTQIRGFCVVRYAFKEIPRSAPRQSECDKVVFKGVDIPYRRQF